MMFPKPSKKTKKAKRELDPDYIQWIHGFRCCVPGCTTPYPVHAHHAVSRGAGGSDRTAIPLCPNHHTGLNGIHIIGKIHWQKKFSVNLEETVSELNRKFEAGEKGPLNHLTGPRLNIID